MRIYVLVTSIVPLKIYRFNEGLTRFATDNYNINIYDKEGKKINNPQEYKRKNGSFKNDLFDKEGRKLLDLKALSKRKTLQIGKSK